MNFDPYFEYNDKLPYMYRIKKWPHNFSQLTFPDTEEEIDVSLVVIIIILFQELSYIIDQRRHQKG